MPSSTSLRRRTNGFIAVGAFIPLLLWGRALAGTPPPSSQSLLQTDSQYRYEQSSSSSGSGAVAWKNGLISPDARKRSGSLATPATDRTDSRVLPGLQASAQDAPLSFVGASLFTVQAEAAATLGSTVPPQILRWQPFIEKYASQYGLDPNLLAAIIMTESGGNPNATSSRGAVGLMQVVGGSYDPQTNIAQGTKILADDLRQFNGNVELALAAYNAGPASVNRYQGIPPYLETENYVFAVMNRYYLYSPS